MVVIPTNKKLVYTNLKGVFCASFIFCVSHTLFKVTLDIQIRGVTLHCMAHRERHASELSSFDTEGAPMFI